MNAELFLKRPRRGNAHEVETQNFASLRVTPHKRSAVWNLMQRTVVLMMVCQLILSIASAQNVFVATTGNDSSSGASWETAKATLAAGIAQAGTNGTVFVKAGSYTTSAEVTILPGVTVMGGFSAASTGTDTSLRNLPGANLHWNDNTWCTIIKGAGDHRIATVHGTLDGCVVRNGYTDTYGGGVLIDGANAMVRYCVIKECEAINDNDGVAAEGGGAYVQNGGTLLNCVVTECRGDKGAGVAGGNGSLISNTITRNRPTDCGIVADYDGNIYKTVVIGDQCWMRENLRTTHYADGTLIPEGTTNSSTLPYRYKGYVTDAQHLQDPSIFVRCGYLYNWPAVMHGAASSSANPSDVQGICPDGWHVPSQSECLQMIMFVQSVSRYWCGSNSTYIAKALASKEGWLSSNTDCDIGYQVSSNNATRFSAIASGFFNNNYNSYGENVLFWSSTISSSNPWRFCLSKNSKGANDQSTMYPYAGFSVRCVKNSSN